MELSSTEYETSIMQKDQNVVSMIWLALGLLVIGFVSGCGNSNGTFELSGTVKFDGAPMQAGTISFAPMDKDTRPAGAMFKDGAYFISAKDGLMPGEYLVKIYGEPVQVSTEGLSVEQLMLTTEEQHQSTVTPAQPVPAEYNTASRYVIEITSTGPNVFDFEIQSK